MNHQEVLLKIIRKKLAPELSLIDEIATVLEISYDAAHRRVTLKSKFSMEEAIALCKQYKVSMDAVYDRQDKIVVSKSKNLTSMADMPQYFDFALEKISVYAKDNYEFYYLAKDIPFFYTLDFSLLAKFKMYAWKHLLFDDYQASKFEDFAFNQSLFAASLALKEKYEKANIFEIWNESTLNSTLQQLDTFFETGLIQLKNALNILDDLLALLQRIEDKCIKNEGSFHFYINDMLILDNTIMVKNEKKSIAFIPFNMIRYFAVEDEISNAQTFSFIQNQLFHSKCLNTAGVRDRNTFFLQLKNRIERYKMKFELAQ
jgi:hypothetical protein